MIPPLGPNHVHISQYHGTFWQPHNLAYLHVYFLQHWFLIQYFFLKIFNFNSISRKIYIIISCLFTLIFQEALLSNNVVVRWNVAFTKSTRTNLWLRFYVNQLFVRTAAISFGALENKVTSAKFAHVLSTNDAMSS